MLAMLSLFFIILWKRVHFLFVCLFVYMNRNVYQPGDQLRNQLFKRTENPRRSDLPAVQSQISSRSGVSNSRWPPVITDAEGRPRQSSRRELEKVLLWAHGSPYLACHGSTVTHFTATAGFTVYLLTCKEQHAPVFLLLHPSA